MNIIAIHLVQGKFMKTFFALPDNTLNNKLNQILSKK